MPEEIKGVIVRVTVEKIYLGMAFQRKYHVRYSSGVERCYTSPPDTVTKFIKENKRDMTKVAFTFKDGS